MRENSYKKKAYNTHPARRDPQTLIRERAQIKCHRLTIAKGTAD